MSIWSIIGLAVWSVVTFGAGFLYGLSAERR